MTKEEALGGDFDPWVSSKGSEVVPEACLEEELQGGLQGRPRPDSQSSRQPEMKPVLTLLSPRF